MDDLELSVLIVGNIQRLADRVGCSRQNIAQYRGAPLPPVLAGKIELAVREAVAEDSAARARYEQIGRLPTAEAMAPQHVFHRDADGGLHLTIGRRAHPPRIPGRRRNPLPHKPAGVSRALGRA